MCFGGGGSYSGYGKIGCVALGTVDIRVLLIIIGGYRFDRRFRIYAAKDFGETIETYKRTEHGEITDRQVLVGYGAPPPFPNT